MTTKLCDLHCHSTASDGTLSPTKLISKARDNGLKTLALTDHDTFDGLAEAQAAADKKGIMFIPGIEISIDYLGTFHLLGYFIDYNNSEFIKTVRALQLARAERNPKIIAKLNDLGVKITYADVVAQSGGGQVGRVHFAKALVKNGWVATISEAFDKYLAKGKPAYLPKAYLSPAEGIALIKQAGGKAVIAHPFTLQLDPGQTEKLLIELKAQGLAGIEVYYPMHTKEQIKLYAELADKYQLVKTAGTDFHGDNRNTELGKGLEKLGFKNDAVNELLAS